MKEQLNIEFIQIDETDPGEETSNCNCNCNGGNCNCNCGGGNCNCNCC